MKHNNLVKISISTALAAVLFAGCGNSGTPAASLAENSTQTQKQSQEKPLAQSLNTLSGKIRLDTTPVNNRTTYALGNNVYSITAYNLNDDSVYKTTTNASGIYTLSGLSDGEYQIYAQNDEVAKSAIKRVTLERGTRKVVDFVLQAAGSIKGQIKDAEVVYIPGKDFIAIPDENGYFELTNIPVGTYVLKYEIESNGKDYYYDDDSRTGTLDITVQEGMTDLSLITPSFDMFKINTELPYGTLGLHHHGIGIKSDFMIDPEVLSKAVVLTNAAGEEIPVHVELHYENYGLISTKEIVPAGDYTLTIPASVSKNMTRDFVQTFHVDKRSVAFTENDTGSGARYLNLALPVKLDDTQKASLGTLTVKEKGSTQTITVKAVWTGDDKIALFGNYKNGVEYIIELTDAQKEIVGEVKNYGEKLMFGMVELNGVYPYDGAEEVNIHEPLYANIQNIRELDPATVKFTLSDGTQTTTYEKGDIVFTYPQNYAMSSYNNYYDGYNGAIGIKNARLAYGKTYTLKVEAKDIYGNPLIAESRFATLTPAVRNLSPNDMEELFRGDLRVDFNVEIQKEAGEVTIVDLTDPAQKPEINIYTSDNKQDPYMKDFVYFSSNSIPFDVEGLKPEHKYKITASGFKSKDGTEIPAKSSEFTTPPKMLFIPEEYKQNIFVNPQNFEHKVRFFVFGGLSDAEKAFMEEHLQVTSYGTATTPDATHPVRKLFFLEESDGVEVVVAFTIDENTNYELAFNDISGLSGIVMPRGFEAGKPLVSFSTQKMDGAGNTTPGDHALIRNMRVYADGAEGKIELDAAIPLGKTSVHESCWDRFGNGLESIDLTGYVHVTDKENKEVPVFFNEYMNSSMGFEYLDDNMKMCTLYVSGWETNAHFPVDYNNSYIVTADFTQDFADSGYTALSLSKELKTAPIGEMDYWIDDNGGKDAVLFHIHTNAPLVNPNILKVTIDEEEYRPSLPYGEMYDDQTPPVNDIVFELPRPLYSLVSFTLSKDDGTVLKFFNPLNQTETERGDLLSVSKTFTESISPDFVPVKVETVHTASTQNRFVIAEFNRMLRMDDIATYSDPDKTQLSDVAFEIKDGDGTPVVISGVKQMGTTIGFELSEELNASKIYTLSLKDGKTVQSAFGVQKLTSLSQAIDLTVIDIRDAYISGINSMFDPVKPYMLGATEELYAEKIGFNYMAVPVGTAEGLLIDIAKSRVNVHTPKGDIVNQGPLVADGNLLIQPIGDYYDYFSLVADVSVSYTYQNETKEYTKTLNNISQQPVAELYSIAGEGVNSLRFNFFDMDPASISEANFRIFNMDETPASDVTLSVQVDPDNPNSAIVTFDGLAEDAMYRVDVVGLSAYGDLVYPDTLVSQVYIQTPAPAE